MSAQPIDYTEIAPEMEPQPIHTRAMKVSLRLSTWTARKYDKAATKQTTDANGAANDAGRFNKMLLPGDVLSYKALMKLAGSIRTDHYANTLAWSDEGWRLLPTANFDKYSDFVRQAKGQFQDLLEDFLAEYPRLRDAARLRLGSMYDERDYPTVSQIRGKFGFYLDYSPLPVAGDFRLDLPREQVRLIEAESLRRQSDAIGDAMKDAWGRLYTCVSHIQERLSNPDGIFRDSLISNAADLCDVLGRLNVTGDVNLSAMVAEIQENIACNDPDMLRESPELRQAAADIADDIVARMAAFYTPEVK